MAKIGLNSFYYSHLTGENAQTGAPIYDGDKSLGKAVNCDVSINSNSAELYADDVLAESDTTFSNGTVALGVDDDREATFADLLGHQTSEAGEVKRNANDVAPYVGVGRIIVKLVENVRVYKTEILYKVKFSEPNQSEQTKGESVTFSTPSIEGRVSTLSNGDWSDAKTFTSKADAVAYIKSVFAPPTP
jgi:phi13 family phage major tail protein